jgi:hypothetical protein
VHWPANERSCIPEAPRGAKRFRRKLSRPEGVLGAACPQSGGTLQVPIRNGSPLARGLISLCENYKRGTSAAEAGLILLHLCRGLNRDPQRFSSHRTVCSVQHTGRTSCGERPRVAIKRRRLGSPELAWGQESGWREGKRRGVLEVARDAAGRQKPIHSSHSIPIRQRKDPSAFRASP